MVVIYISLPLFYLRLDDVNTCTMKSCSNVASIVGAVLGILLAIVITILVILIMKLRNQGKIYLRTQEKRINPSYNI